jgi:flagellar hook-associated protein 1 FlgK
MPNDLFSSLYSTTSALRAQSAALDIVGRNMSNVNNTSYARQRVILGDKGSVDTSLGTQSLGIEAVGIQQMRDSLLDRQIVEEESNSGFLESQQSYLEQAQTALGQGLFNNAGTVDTIKSNTALPSGIAASIDTFFNAWQSLATEPGSTVNKQMLIADAQDLVDKLNTADKRLADISLDTPVVDNTLTGQMDEGARQVNGILSTIADLNRQIGRVEVSNPGTAVDLRDQRQAKLEELAGYIDFTAVQQTAGQIGIQVDALPAGTTVDLVSLATVNGTMVRSGADYTWNDGTTTSTLDFDSGKLAGYQEVGATVEGYRTKLDAFVSALVTSVNTAYQTVSAGPPPVLNTNGSFFNPNPANLTAGTISLGAGITATTVTAGDAGGPSGANDRALAVAALAKNTGFLSGSTPAAAFAKIVTQVGQDVSNNDTRIADQSSLVKLLGSQRQSYSGVSLDEETADMLRYQRAYQASAKMLSVIDELLSTMLNTLS